ncbi:hypothetical protein [Metabacillus fastidiosus]|uniref:hypothetical protein n=1 Tax=Metabacillus fastidiosus TaxID=1458 RepID=UPI002DBDB5D7|nr:hypothetical protein [Metabacillus fastidiosus]MEC2077732.1 hypothetical protein [Metabacillus fastidiosus]
MAANIKKNVFISLPEVTPDCNQRYFRLNYMKEFVKEQQAMNKDLTDAANEVNDLIHKTRDEQVEHFYDLYKHLEEQKAVTSPLLSDMETQKLTSEQMINQLHDLEKQNEELLKKLEAENQISQVIVDQLTIQDKSFTDFSRRIKESEEIQQSLTEQLDQQIHLNEQMKEKLSLQETFHESVIERINNQEAQTEKVTRDLENLKAIVFERISHVVEKIEENYKLSKDFIVHLFSKQNEHEEEKEKEHVK